MSKSVYWVFWLSVLMLSACKGTGGKEGSVQPGEAFSQKINYKKIVEILQSNDAVIPPRPNIHPVDTVYNREAIIPPMCYTRTESQHNPCYVCHQNAIELRENVMNDGGLQAAYSFSDLGMSNHWENLFQNRSQRVGQISDKEIIEWVNQDNYTELAVRLKDAGFKGWVPDLRNLQLAAEAFDDEGFAKDGSHWVAFNYKPFPSTFWPTNGSTDDVMIKLPESYRTDKAGKYSRDIYKTNLAIVEAKIKGFDEISSSQIDERKVGVDLDRDGQLGIAKHIKKTDRYVGAAEDYFIDSYLYPEGTEFLHTVRYLGFDEKGEVTLSKRMKEVRYMKKWKSYPKAFLERHYEEEAFDKEAGNLPGYTFLADHGLDNDAGWSVQGFIEDRNGRLRVSTYEENLFCMGCHSSIGSTIDKTFSFGRKIDGARGWGYINLKGMPDAPNMGEEKGEIQTYFERAGGGDEFRSNPEMRKRWFNQDGSLNYSAIKNKDVYELIVPSRERALTLNKAYKVIVEDQRFLFGRDATVTPLKNVYEHIDNKTAPSLKAQFLYDWDIRLAWDKRQIQ